MKKVILLTIFAGIVAVSANAQTDPSLSSDNYKHPNKASFAKKSNLDKKGVLPVLNVAPESYSNQTGSNYKGNFYLPSLPIPITVPVVTEFSEPSLFSRDNYKAQSKNISEFETR